MSYKEDLINLIENEVLIDINEYIDELNQVIVSSDEIDEEVKEDYEDAQSLKDEFMEILNDANAGDLNEEECAEIIDEINAIRAEEE